MSKIDNITGMAEQMEPLLSQNQFPDECIIEIKQHPSKFVLIHFLPSNNFPLIFSFLHPMDLPQMMWVNKAFRKDSYHYIKKLTASQKILIFQKITQSTIKTIKKITKDFEAYFRREVSDSLISSDDLDFYKPQSFLSWLLTSTSKDLDPVEQLLYPVREDRLNEEKNKNLLQYTASGFVVCGGTGLWATLFMWVGKIAPLTLKITASASGGIIVLSFLILSSRKSIAKITQCCFRKGSTNFHGYNLWNEEAMRLRRAIAYLRLLDVKQSIPAPLTVTK